jgi:hypothetical protein
VFGRQPPLHLPRHVLFRVLAYRLQADRLGDLDRESQRLLDSADSPERAGQRGVLTHVAEDIFPAMGWGRRYSSGHYLDLASAFLDVRCSRLALSEAPSLDPEHQGT